jgi:hypothetical protein
MLKPTVKVKTEDFFDENGSGTSLLIFVKDSNEWVDLFTADSTSIVDAQTSFPARFQAELIRYISRNRFAFRQINIQVLRRWSAMYVQQDPVCAAYYFPQDVETNAS